MSTPHSPEFPINSLCAPAGRRQGESEFSILLRRSAPLKKACRVIFVRATDLVQALEAAIEKYHFLIRRDLPYLAKDQAETSVFSS